MEKSDKNIEKLTRDWVKEAGLEHPSATFMSDVMKKIETQAVTQKAYRPLVSRGAWLAIAVVFIVGIAVVYVFPAGIVELPYLGNVNSLEIPALKNPFAGIEISKTVIYAIGFMALFLVQIPFLKKRFVN